MPFRPDGFRSSFRDWVAETSQPPFEVAETCLGHTVGGSVERSYRRTDYLDQRRKLMEETGLTVRLACERLSSPMRHPER